MIHFTLKSLNFQTIKSNDIFTQTSYYQKGTSGKHLKLKLFINTLKVPKTQTPHTEHYSSNNNTNTIKKTYQINSISLMHHFSIFKYSIHTYTHVHCCCLKSIPFVLFTSLVNIWEVVFEMSSLSNREVIGKKIFGKFIIFQNWIV